MYRTCNCEDFPCCGHGLMNTLECQDLESELYENSYELDDETYFNNSRGRFTISINEDNEIVFSDWNGFEGTEIYDLNINDLVLLKMLCEEAINAYDEHN